MQGIYKTASGSLYAVEEIQREGFLGKHYKVYGNRPLGEGDAPYFIASQDCVRLDGDNRLKCEFRTFLFNEPGNKLHTSPIAEKMEWGPEKWKELTGKEPPKEQDFEKYLEADNQPDKSRKQISGIYETQSGNIYAVMPIDSTGCLAEQLFFR